MNTSNININSSEKAKKDLLAQIETLAAQEKAAAKLELETREKIDKMINDALAEAFERSIKLSGRDVKDLTTDEREILTARCLKIAKERTAPARKELNAAVKAARPDYKIFPVGLYDSYRLGMLSTDPKAFDEFKNALKNALADSGVEYSVKTCERLAASVGMTRASLKERAEGTFVKELTAESFRRVLAGAIYHQFTAEGLKLTAARAEKIKAAAEKAVKARAEKAAEKAAKKAA